MFNTFSFEPRKIEKILDYREVPEFLEIAGRSLPTSPSLFPPQLAVRRRWTSSTARPRPSGPRKAAGDTWMSAWPLLHSPRAPGTLAKRHAARHASRHLRRPPRRRPLAPGRFDLPRSLNPSPISILTYKSKPQAEPAFSPLLPVLPPPLAPAS